MVIDDPNVLGDFLYGLIPSAVALMRLVPEYFDHPIKQLLPLIEKVRNFFRLCHSELLQSAKFCSRSYRNRGRLGFDVGCKAV